MDCIRKKIQLKYFIFVVVMVLLLTGCGSDGRKVVLTTGFAKDDIFRVGDEVCKKNEIMVYLTTVQNQYESVYGKEIWNANLDGVTLEQNVKDTVLARIAQIKTMYLLAKDRGVTLDEAETSKVEKASAQFFQSLNETEKELLGVTEAVIEKMYTEYALADKVYREIISDVNPEISDDEARIIKVQIIFFSTTLKDGSGKRVDYTGKEKETVYQTAISVKALADSGEKDFEDLAAQYSDDTEITYSFGKNEVEKTIEKTAFNLSNGEISDVIQGDNGYYILRCISTFDREETDSNKIKLVEKRKDEAFGAEYDSFVQGLVRNLNEELWNSVAMIRDEKVDTTEFFQIYSTYFK